MVHDKKEECCGCGACRLVCPINAISMLEDLEGFKYPSIDRAICTNCGLCSRICPFDKKETPQLDTQDIYAVRHKNLSELESSQSGGAFSVLVEHTLQNKGVVYGVVLEDLVVKHIRATDKEECSKFKGSKYVQSDLGNVYSQVKNDLKDGRLVLFSGTPCQVAGLSAFLKNTDTSNLILCDLICHGVPSPRVWGDYAIYLENKYKDKIKSVNFRDKSFGWSTKDTYETILFFSGKKIKSTLYLELFYREQTLRPSCGFCKYSSFNRCSDITIGDFWGWEKSLPHDFNADNKGISLVLVNTELGKKIFEAIKGRAHFIRSNEKECSQRNLHTSTRHSPKRALFWKIYNRYGLVPVINLLRLSEFIKKLVKGNFK